MGDIKGKLSECSNLVACKIDLKEESKVTSSPLPSATVMTIDPHFRHTNIKIYSTASGGIDRIEYVRIEETFREIVMVVINKITQHRIDAVFMDTGSNEYLYQLIKNELSRNNIDLNIVEKVDTRHHDADLCLAVTRHYLDRVRHKYLSERGMSERDAEYLLDSMMPINLD